MFLIEIRHPAEALDAEDRATLAADIASGLVGGRAAADAPEETMSRARAMTHIGFRALDSWTTGDGRWLPDTPPPLWITMTVPDLWREEMARHVVGVLRGTVRRLDRRHGWQRSVGDLWINLVGVADGCIGLDGKPTTADGVVAMMSEEFRAKADADDLDLPDGVVIDPMCGMRVKLGPGAITLERDGRTMAFCARSCRDAYVRQEAITGT